MHTNVIFCVNAFEQGPLYNIFEICIPSSDVLSMRCEMRTYEADGAIEKATVEVCFIWLLKYTIDEETMVEGKGVKKYSARIFALIFVPESNRHGTFIS